jgi:hypothetical protein
MEIVCYVRQSLFFSTSINLKNIIIMARLTNGFLGNASGKLGNVVFAKWKQIYTARQYQPDIQDANSDAQKTQRGRMVALLQFLRPLNKSFIKFFNGPVSQNTTPWAKAIKDNMPAVTSDGCIIPDKITFGEPKYPPVKIKKVTYDPFIDCCKILYEPPDIPLNHSNYPLGIVSVLGMYAPENNNHAFDTRHINSIIPDSEWYCEFPGRWGVDIYKNWWNNGWLFMYWVDMEEYSFSVNPNNALTKPVFFVPESIIDGFNTNIKDNPVPVEAITYKFVFKDDTWFLQISIDPEKTSLDQLDKYSIAMWSLTFEDNKHEITDVMIWDLAETMVEYDISPEGFIGSSVGLYTVINKSDEQVACFNRFYMDHGTDGVSYPLFNQLFDSGYANPLSFILEDDMCGIYGSFDELFNEFITLYEQGLIDLGRDESGIPDGSNTKEIDYDLFICYVFTPDGKMVGRARKNDKHEFYSDSLVIGNNYFLIFTYASQLIDAIAKKPEKPTKVQYISPPVIVNSCEAIFLPDALIRSLTDSYKINVKSNIPKMAWNKKALDNFIKHKPGQSKEFICPRNPYALVAYHPVFKQSS